MTDVRARIELSGEDIKAKRALKALTTAQKSLPPSVKIRFEGLGSVLSVHLPRYI